MCIEILAHTVEVLFKAYQNLPNLPCHAPYFPYRE